MAHIKDFSPHPFKRCSVYNCQEMSIKNRLGRGLCKHHYDNGFAGRNADAKKRAKDPRGKCEALVPGTARRKFCGKPCSPPYSERRCEEHHPRHAPTPLDIQVCEAIAKGADPVTAVEKATGLSKPRAALRLEKMSQRPAFKSLVTESLGKAGITVDMVAERLHDMLDAEKRGMTKDGEVVVIGPDNPSILKAIDTWAKLTASYAPKQTEQKIERQNLNVHIGLPAPEPPSVHTKVITIPRPKD